MNVVVFFNYFNLKLPPLSELVGTRGRTWKLKRGRYETTERERMSGGNNGDDW